ncbi:redox-sensing transcriptional repressor Rex [Eubacteriales bacterium KG127]
MKRTTKISSAVIKRLPRYRRYLYELKKKGVMKISSKEFSEIIGYTASQIRQDLNNFGGFGQQGYGYSVSGLYDEISGILGLDKEYTMVLVGAGNLGTAITKYIHTYKGAFKLCAAFDVKPELIGGKLDGYDILDNEDLVEYVEKNKIDIGIICVNKENAQAIADKLAFAGAKAIWNFAPIDIEVPDRVAVENVHLSDSLHSLAYYMKDIEKQEEMNKAKAAEKAGKAANKSKK